MAQSSMKNHEMTQLAETLVSLRADLDVQHAVTVTRDMAMEIASPLSSKNEPTEIATRLMKSLRSSNGGHIRWPNLKYGQKYTPIIRAVRVMVEHITGLKLTLEGILKGRQVLVEIPKIVQKMRK